MDTMDNAKSRRRRTHSKQLKSEVVAACAEPGASVAAVALARGLNTNLVHKWRRKALPPAGVPVERKTPAAPSIRPPSISRQSTRPCAGSSSDSQYDLGLTLTPQRVRQPLFVEPRMNAVWALDFMRDTLYSGKVFRTLNVIDEANGGTLGIDVATSIPATRVIVFLEQMIDLHGRPSAIRCDYGPELTSDTFVRRQRSFRVRRHPDLRTPGSVL